jgi:hypothetical protein
MPARAQNTLTPFRLGWRAPTERRAGELAANVKGVVHVRP